MRVAVNDPEIATRLVERGRKIVWGCEGNVQPNDFERLKLRLRGLEAGALSEDAVWRLGKPAPTQNYKAALLARGPRFTRSKPDASRDALLRCVSKVRSAT